MAGPLRFIECLNPRNLFWVQMEEQKIANMLAEVGVVIGFKQVLYFEAGFPHAPVLERDFDIRLVVSAALRRSFCD